MPKKQRKKELIDQLLKSEIVETVLSLIKNDEPVTMEEVAKRCGVAKGTLYNYFKDRDDIFQHVYETVKKPIGESTAALFAGDLDPAGKIHTFIDFIFSIHHDVSTYMCFLSKYQNAEAEISKRVEMVIRPLAKICKEGIETGTFIDVNPEILANMIFGVTIGTLQTTLMENEDRDSQYFEKLKQEMKMLVDRIILR